MDINHLYIIAFCVVWITQIQQWRIFQTRLLKRKPFTCELCMGFWITFAYQLYTHQDVGLAFVIALACPVALNIYNRIIRWTLK